MLRKKVIFRCDYNKHAQNYPQTRSPIKIKKKSELI